MTVTSGFFNSVNHDRLYDAEQVSSMFDGIIIDGVYENYGEALNVTAYSGANSTVIVGTGRAWFDHTWTLNDSQFSITLDPPNELLGRTDSIVIDIDKTQSVRKNSIIYVKGSESTPDLPPTLINTDLHKQYPICYVNRPAGSNKPVTQSDITITVGTSVCPMVTGILEAQNLENLMQQLDDEFNTWWDGIKETLDDNVATNLQNQIDEINEKLNSDTALVGLLEKPIAEAFMSGDYGLSASSFSISPSNSSSNTSFFNPLVSLLPDGKVLAVYPIDGSIEVKIYNTDGISTSTTKDLYSEFNQYFEPFNGYTSSSKVGHDWEPSNSRPSFDYGNVQIDVYPVTFDVVVSEAVGHSPLQHPDNGYCAGQFGKIRCVVTSSGSVTFQDSIAYAYDPEDDYPYGADIAECNPIVTNELSDGSKIFCVMHGWANTQDIVSSRPFFAVSLSSQGVLSDIVYTNLPSVDATTGSFKYSANKLITFQDGDTVITGAFYNRNPSDYITIDKNSLIPTYVKQNYGSSPQTYFNNYESRLFTLGEKTGVMSSVSIPGGNKTYQDIKKSNYFIGASNLGEPLPEGAYIANVIDDRLYGIGPSGEQIAIGTNGGAAILKEKKTSVSINRSSIVTMFLGYTTINNTTYYLQNTSGKNFSVLKIGSKGGKQ